MTSVELDSDHPIRKPEHTAHRCPGRRQPTGEVAMSHSPTWQNTRAKRAERRAADPQVQAKARAHRAREERDRQKAHRAAQAEQDGAAA